MAPAIARRGGPPPVEAGADRRHGTADAPPAPGPDDGFDAACAALHDLATALLACNPLTLRPGPTPIGAGAAVGSPAWRAAVQAWWRCWQPAAQARLHAAVDTASQAHAAWLALARAQGRAGDPALAAHHAGRLALHLREHDRAFRAACPMDGLQRLRLAPHAELHEAAPLPDAGPALDPALQDALDHSARAGALALHLGRVDAAIATLCQDLLGFCGDALHRLQALPPAPADRRARARALLAACVSAHLRPGDAPVAAALGQAHSYRCRDLQDTLAPGPAPGPLARLRAAARMTGWALICAAAGRRRRALAATPDTDARRQAAWRLWLHWAARSARWLGVQVRLRLAPGTAARWLALRQALPSPRLLLLPTHQGVIDHVAMYRAAADPGWQALLGPHAGRAWTLVARTGLAALGPTLRGRTVFGDTAARWDDLLQTLDGYLLAGRQSPHALRRALRDALDYGPVLLYPMGTTAAYDGQVLPAPSGVLSALTPDVLVVPIALHGSHRVWPKSPRGNWALRPGRVDVVVLPPLAAGGLLLPPGRGGVRQDALAALVQALHAHAMVPDTAGGAVPGEPLPPPWTPDP